MNKKKILISGLVIASIVTLLVYNYVFNSKHRNIAEEKATVVLSAGELHSDFTKNEILATTNYLDKVVEATGKITSVEGNDVVLNDGVQVSFNALNLKEHKEGEALTIKGRCVGYDELLELVKIDQAILINK